MPLSTTTPQTCRGGDGIRSEYRPNLNAVDDGRTVAQPDQSQLFTGISGAGWSACQLPVAKAPGV